MPLHPDLTPLALPDPYLVAAPASPYWALAPHHIQQMTDSSCSLATTVMLLNALGAAETEAGLLERLGDRDWRDRITPEIGGGLPLRFMAGRWAAALAARGLAGWAAEGVAVETAGEALPGLRAALAEMEAGRAWVAANFHLDRLYGDGSQIGHWSPVAAYDAARDRALILDVYRQDYAPHWAPLPRLAAAMALRDPETREARGYAVLRRVG